MSACQGSRQPAVMVHEFFLASQRWGTCPVCGKWVRLKRHDVVKRHKAPVAPPEPAMRTWEWEFFRDELVADAEAERDRARATAVALEQELAAVRDAAHGDRP